MPSKSNRTATLDYKLSKTPENDASTVLRHASQGGMGTAYHHWPFPGKHLSSHLQELVMGATLTAPVSYSQPHWDLFRTSVYPAVVAGMVPGKRRLSLRASRLIALGIMADTEIRLWRERANEAQFFVSLWNYETDDLRNGTR